MPGPTESVGASVGMAERLPPADGSLRRRRPRRVVMAAILREAAPGSTTLEAVAGPHRDKAAHRAVRAAIHGICGQSCGELFPAGPAVKHIKLLRSLPKK